MNILPVVLSMSLSGAALILLIIIIRLTAFKRLSKRTLTVLWLIAAVKLLVPFNHCTDALAKAYPDGTSETVVVEERAVFSNPINIALEREFVGTAVYVWLFGAVFAAFLAVFMHIINRRRFACALPCGYDISLLKNAYGIRRRVRLRISDRTDAPFTYGVFAPVIILPKSIAEAHIENVLRHELAHIKRCDVLFRGLLTVCAAVHWFNPLVWIMLALAVRDTELACDETAVQRGKAVPVEYALTLIGMEERRGPAASLGFSGGSLEQRIRELMRREKNCRTGAVGTAAVLLSAAAAVFINSAVVSFDGTYPVYTADDSAMGAAEEVYYGIEVQQAAEADAAEEYVLYTVTDNAEEVKEDVYYSIIVQRADNGIVEISEASDAGEITEKAYYTVAAEASESRASAYEFGDKEVTLTIGI